MAFSVRDVFHSQRVGTVALCDSEEIVLLPFVAADNKCGFRNTIQGTLYPSRLLFPSDASRVHLQQK